MLMLIRIFYPDGRDEIEEVKCRPVNVDDIHRIVDPIIGKPLEHVNVYWPFTSAVPRYLDAFVNEDGHRRRLPLNRKATLIYHNNTRVHRPNEYEPKTMPVIVGPMVLFQRKVWI